MKTPAAIWWVLLVLLFPSEAAPAVPGRQNTSQFTLLARGADRWTIEYRPGEFSSTPVSVAGKTYRYFGGDAITGMIAPGTPRLPVEVLSLGVPWGSSVNAVLADPVYEEQPGVLVAPCPTYAIDSGRAVPSFLPDPAAYSQNRSFPDRQVVVEPPFTLRQQRISALRIAPYLYNPSTRVLRRLVRARLEITLVSDERAETQSAPRRPRGEDPRFEDVYRGLLWNYEEAKAWRGEFVPGMTEDPSGDWFTSGQKYFRVPIAADGWYALSRAQLQEAGVPVAEMAMLQLFHKGREIPMLARGDTSLEFYGVRNYGDSTYIDFYTDTSAYWLTRGTDDGLRYAWTDMVVPPGGGTVSRSSLTTLHEEKNTDYYEGTGEREVTSNENMPGEGWVWEYYYPWTTITHEFTLDSVDAGQDSAALRVRLFGTTVHLSTPDHRAEIWINDSLAGEIAFDGREGVTLDRSIPVSWLVTGVNRLKVTSKPTASEINQFYLDWFEVDYPRLLRASDGQLTFTLPPGDTMRATVTGLPGSEVDIIDLLSARRLAGPVIGGDPETGFTVSFADTVSSARRYVVIVNGRQMPAHAGAGKIFPGLRENAAGADYIIVTHGDFLQEAERLAAMRRSVNGVRAVVADVQDIYDEFNYGEPDAAAIKKYLQHAYTAWPSPAPAYLLMLGDATWDYHYYMPNSRRVNFVPSYGVPTGDNWFGCFDTATTASSLLIGRVCVQTVEQATRMVDKIIGFETTPLGDWNKRFMFITGGITLYEQMDFNSTTEPQIESFVAPAPLGGTAIRIYKSSPYVIDGEHTQAMRGQIKEGLAFVNFLGHSGGRTWGVDIGSPHDMENTTGQLPFVSSVSCNVGAFAEPSHNLLSEEFLLAHNRGAIAVWSSSSLGYAYTGSILVDNFLRGLSRDSLRDFGKLTSAARYRLLMEFGNSSITAAAVNCTPLQGDPLSRFPLPLKPDLAISPGDITLLSSGTTNQDSTTGLRIRMHNYGSVTPESVLVSVADVFRGTRKETRYRVGQQFHRDSLSIPWSASADAGKHSIVVSIDPDGAINEMSRANNETSIDEYVYARTLVAIKPADNALVEVLPQTLSVSLPGSGGIPGMHVLFELDTLASFASSFRVQSGPVAPGPVSATWKTPALLPEQAYFWRSRTVSGENLGEWTGSAFRTGTGSPALPVVRRIERSPEQFRRNTLVRTACTDSGVVITPRDPLLLWSFSYGERGGISSHVYSRIGINNQVIWGYEWEVGHSFIGIRVNEFDGTFTYKSFDVKNRPTLADSMKDFINTTPAGNYVVFSVIFDGHTNVTESLMVAIESVGSREIRNVLPGQSWAFIGRKGFPGDALEQRTDDTAFVTLQVPNFYSYGSGSIVTPVLPPAVTWHSFHWRGLWVAGVTGIQCAVLGIRPGGAVDTLRIVPPDSADISLAFLDDVRDRYAGYRFLARMWTGDALRTPVLREWWTDAELAGDPAISSQSVGAGEVTVERGKELSLPVTITNLGYQNVDSTKVILSIYDAANALKTWRTVVVGAVMPDSSMTVVIPLTTEEAPARTSIHVHVEPLGGQPELLEANNEADYQFLVTGGYTGRVQVSADGITLLNGDFLPAEPRIDVQISDVVEGALHLPSVEASVDGHPVASAQGAGVSFTPVLAVGKHDLRVVARLQSALGYTDSLVHTLSLQVVDEYRIMHLFNYPNPFAGGTFFSFVLTGARVPDEGMIRVYTVAGRKIREIRLFPSELRIGVNKVPWDGRDNDGDEIANGYYFYQVQVSAGEKMESVIGKMARVR